MRRYARTIALVAMAWIAFPAFAQEQTPEDAGLLFAMGGVHYHVRDSLTGALADEPLANLRAEVGVGMLARGNPELAPFVYGGDFRFLLSFVPLSTATVVHTDVPLRGGFGAQFGDVLVAAVGGPGIYTTIVDTGGDATRIGVGYEVGAKAVFTWGLYAEATFVAPEGIALLQGSQFLGPQRAGLRLGIGWNFLSATPDEARELSAAAEQ